MDKSKLNKIFSEAFELQEWQDILKEVFGAKQLFTEPKKIILNNNDKAKSATELGSFATSDDRIIGLYHVIVNDDIWLERNKVGLRELLRNIYRYDVDGALVVFEQGDKWRLSFISEIKVLNDEGEVIKQATEPKRYTYLLGVDEKIKTPSERIANLIGKKLALKDILNAFSVEALNEEFYKIISEYFYQLVGGNIGKGKSAKKYDPKLKLPIPIDNHQIYQEFVVRLIGRTIFCWFLKMKKSDEGVSLMPENLLSSQAVKNNNGYYHNILERLFFQTLNTRMDERVDGLPTGCERIPFLNGGLFEPNSDDYYKPNRLTGISENINTLIIEDNWFFELFQELEKYNFTIDENSVTDVEVSVDPEMLGRIFENLLAEFDPDSGETARKATGSFYTPREIVDYMATESLVQYVHNKTSIASDKIRPMFKMTEEPDPTFNDSELEGILDALDKVKILDPACGSGAFPMGVLQKIVQALQKLDANADWWKKRQVSRISNPIIRKALKEKLDSSGVEYARKIGVIQNSLYGVDIQPIAAEISKLRCFLTLIVDEKIDETKPNRGIEPLPNLEFKFVTADTLQKLPQQKAQRGLFDNYEEQELLKELRIEYLQISGKKKEKIKELFINTQQKMFKNEMHLFTDTNSRGYKLSSWNPFSHDKADWFDPQWMFGIEKFDIVIGNPPYHQLSKDKTVPKSYKDYLKQEYKTSGGRLNTFIFFIHKGLRLLKTDGVISYIIPNTILTQDYYSFTRTEVLNENTLCQVINYLNMPFANAVVENVTLIIQKGQKSPKYSIDFYEDNLKLNKLIVSKTSSDFLANKSVSWNYNSNELIEKIKNNSSDILDKKFNINQAIALKGDKSLSLKEENPKGKYYKLLDGRNINKYKLEWSGVYLDYDLNRIHSCKRKDIFQTDEKLMFRRVSSNLIFTYDNQQYFALNTIVVLTRKAKNINYKYFLGVLNSDLLNYYYKLQHKSTKKVFSEIQARSVKQLPIPKSSENSEKAIERIVDYILFINQSQDKIAQKVTNDYLATLFNDIVNAMVIELYFTEDFNKVNIEFVKYIELDFESIEGKSESEQIEIINKAYQKLNEKDNEIRNNLKLMDIKLADIVLPIKSAK